MMLSNSIVAAALLILSVSLWSCTTALGDDAVDCCLTTSDRRIPQKVVTTFTLQTGEGGCRVPATIFVTKKGLKLCAPFPSQNNWVSRLIDHILGREKPAQKRPRKSKGKKQRQQ
ncbi:C-C motif chemokine 19b precursor [Danio rerio]|uniref:C-C motif chemokine 19b precursor n=1 Tax=Danio rerio TaxID=7955 RepID=A0A8M1P631_DANRE|nr:C-C motif chemokine 19b precursor [Danio rerio]|eukprot:NP_001289630.1 chemokine (C-C motif) ligand 19b precursor [Danio rerio]